MTSLIVVLCLNELKLGQLSRKAGIIVTGVII